MLASASNVTKATAWPMVAAPSLLLLIRLILNVKSGMEMETVFCALSDSSSISKISASPSVISAELGMPQPESVSLVIKPTVSLKDNALETTTLVLFQILFAKLKLQASALNALTEPSSTRTDNALLSETIVTLGILLMETV